MAEAPPCESSSEIVVAAEWLDQVGSGSGEAWREDAIEDGEAPRRGPARVEKEPPRAF